ncbi:hypothetical protein E2C01_016365 [Portunus trituberculatus]|uniref:Uncharacterized protein n=1 Tax=Portunus trituberculatus TaxID=210409 RepID=A0A5B7DNV2_PORTR|nr:hypothetical protein [Portunus trituberculatus]
MQTPAVTGVVVDNLQQLADIPGVSINVDAGALRLLFREAASVGVFRRVSDALLVLVFVTQTRHRLGMSWRFLWKKHLYPWLTEFPQDMGVSGHVQLLWGEGFSAIRPGDLTQPAAGCAVTFRPPILNTDVISSVLATAASCHHPNSLFTATGLTAARRGAIPVTVLRHPAGTHISMACQAAIAILRSAWQVTLKTPPRAAQIRGVPRGLGEEGEGMTVVVI